MQKRSHSKAKDWLPLIQEWQQSNVSKKAFCEQKNIAHKKFYHWCHKLSQEDLPRQTHSLAPLTKPFIPVKVKEVSPFFNTFDYGYLELSSQLKLHLPLKAMNIEFLRLLFKAAEGIVC